MEYQHREEFMPTPVSSNRIESLDQFRGYTVAGMFLVNFVGGYAAVHPLLGHHDTYCSYADTIMPQFFFAVGFAYRLTMTRRLATLGARPAILRVCRRLLGLLLVALVIYHPATLHAWSGLTAATIGDVLAASVKRNLFQTLTHIAVTSLWVLPVIARGAGARIGFAAGSAGLHVLLSYGFNFHWVWTDPKAIDGGPLGFLTWTIPVIVGSLACDALTAHRDRPPLVRLFAWSVVLMAGGYACSCASVLYDVGRTPASDSVVAWPADSRIADSPVWPALAGIGERRTRDLLVEPPFIAPPGPQERLWNYWMMSQRAGTLSYLTFASGLSLAIYAFFVYLADIHAIRVGVFGTLGRNALAGYILHSLVAAAISPLAPRDCPLWYVLAAFVVYFAITYVLVRYLEKNEIYLRL